MFGFLMGTLQKFKESEEAHKLGEKVGTTSPTHSLPLPSCCLRSAGARRLRSGCKRRQNLSGRKPHRSGGGYTVTVASK